LIALLLAAAAAFPAPAQASVTIIDDAGASASKGDAGASASKGDAGASASKGDAASASNGASGLRAFLDAAGVYARSLSSAEIGHGLREQLAVDPLTLTGPRTIVFARRATGLVATMEPAKARAALKAWKRPWHVGLVAKGRLYTASGRDAQALLKALQRAQPLSVKGPVAVWFAVEPPLRSATFTVQASAQGLSAEGRVTASKPLLQGPKPTPCAGTPPGCFVAGLGPAGHELLVRALVYAGEPTPRAGPTGGTRIAARLDRIDASALGRHRTIPDAMLYAAAFDAIGWPADARCQTPPDVEVLTNPRCEAPPPLEAAGEGAELSADPPQVAAALSRLTALDALKGEAAAGAYATYLLYGQLLRHLGPLTMRAQAAENDAAEVSLQLPLH
jgi:hypothetical protein